MRHGFIKVAAATPDIRVADVDYNKGQIIKQMDEAAEAGAKIIVFPELCITGYTCSDLFLQDILLNSAKKALVEIAEHTKNLDALVFVGVPIAVGGELYNVAAALNHGNILGFHNEELSVRIMENSMRCASSVRDRKKQRKFCLAEKRFHLDRSFYLWKIRWLI